MYRITRSTGVAILPSLLLALCASRAFAQTQPAAGVEVLEATITGIEGMVQVRQGEDQPWVKAEIGMKVGELGEFRTSLKSAVRFTIPPDQTVTLDRLGIIKLLVAVNDNGKLKTNLGMKYGRTRFAIEAAGREHDASISSPSSTLAVRGTVVMMYDQRPFVPEAVSLTGRADFRDGKKQLAFGGKNAGTTKVNTEQPNAASLALGEATLDPTVALARTDSETALIEHLFSTGATVTFDRDIGIKVVRGGFPPTDQQLTSLLPGVLTFVARWNTDADLNFSVAAPGGPNGGGEMLYPIGALSQTSTGGKVAFDHRGGPNGGFEVVYFSSTPPEGLYGLGLTLISGPTTTAQVDAFLNGEHVGIFDGQSTVQTAVVNVVAPIPGFVDGTVVGVVPIGLDLPAGGSAPVVAQAASVKPAAIAQATTVKPAAAVNPRTTSRVSAGNASITKGKNRK